VCNVRIQALQCRDFKAHSDISLTFGNRVSISGENYIGKTSIAEAIVVGLFGTTLTGSPYTEELIRDYGKPTAAKKFEVAVTFEVDGEIHEVVRVRGKKSEVYLDGAKSSQNEVDKLIGEKERFLTVFAPGYFTSQPDKDGREMLMKLVKAPTQQTVLDVLDSSIAELLKEEVLRDPEALAKDKRAEIKATDAEIQKEKGKLEILRERVSRPIPDPMKFDELHLEELKKQLADKTTGTVAELKQLRQQSQSFRSQYDLVKGQIKKVPAAPYHEGDNCPVCQRALDEDALTAVLANHHTQAHQIEASNTELTSKAHTILQQGVELKAQIEALEAQVANESATDTIRAEISRLEAEKAQVIAHNGHATRISMEVSEDKTRVEKTESYLKELEADKFKMAEQVRALTEYRAKYAEIQVGQLKQFLNRVDIQLFDIAKTTGEIKPVFNVMYDGKEFKTLSTSERIRVNLEFATLFNKVLGRDHPVYIDNIESITHFNEPAATQLFLSKVVKGQDLKVESEIPTEIAKGDVA